MNFSTVLSFIVCLLSIASVHAGTKLTATGAVSPIEGGSGGGISPWATISGYGSSGEWGGNAFHTQVHVDDYRLEVSGVGLAYSDRVEITAARQTLDVEPLDLTQKQNIYGAKVRVFGELLYSRSPQISLGVQYKETSTFAVPRALGADSDSAVDVYLAGSKLWFAAFAGRNVLANFAIRNTAAIETGLLGHANERSWVAEGSIALFLSDNWVTGVEYRQKPNHLDAIEEKDWYHGFIGYFPTKQISITAAWVNLDEIAGFDDQRGWYLSLQGHF